jgi:alkanesulfonate monooxygenase SsuD/methylene tetrahydromethanopterin reductase-like flavin-dependent oxidoreductase (luciferase family)
MIQFHYFVNQSYIGYPHEAAAEFGAVMLKFPNRHFDAQWAADLFDRYHREFVLAEQVGFDTVLVNEHHNAPLLSPIPNISATVLAKITSRVKIFIGGNILPTNGNPLRLAEELAMIDLISKGRLISGFVRGGAFESLALSANTMHNREVFEEAHDVILAAWTRPGPFVWEGKHFNYRVVNPWVLPYQKPHPPIMIPGSTSRETVDWAAQRGYPYIALATSLEATDNLFRSYNETATAAGHRVGPGHRGYMIRVHVAEDEAKAHEEGRELFGNRVAQVTSMSKMKIHPDAGAWMAPPGYVTREAARQRRKYLGGTPFAFFTQGYEGALANNNIIVGTPEQVVAKLDALRRRWQLGHLGIANLPIEEESRAVRNLELFGTQVFPRLRELAAADSKSAERAA